MTNVADATDFELSKENIQPIQQGRKAEVLKSALTVQPEDKLVQQRRLFEQELRSYSGDDPLSIWCRYIKWVEQNYPKGGREGNIGKLIQQCLLILREETKYYNDDRFIGVWLKFAKMSLKPLEVYSNMYSHGMGCQNARFYMTWAWENEQLGNLKRADDILLEGIKRNAQPIETLRSTHADLEMRLAQAIGAEVDKVKYDGLQEPEQRSAFTMLKAQSKNKAPVSRVGDSTIATNRQNMTINQQQQQQQQTKNSQGKLPFKIYSGDNEANGFPTQSKKGSNPTAHSQGTKENERKPSKWSKVKVQQTTTSHVREPAKTQEFVVHCDDTPQPNSVKKLPPTSQILTSRKWPVEPPVAIFEPPNPLMRPMYDKMKVYGGAEEFSFEELMAIKWAEKQKKAEDERKRQLEEQEKEQLKATMKKMQEEISYLKDLALQRNKEKDAKTVNLEAKPVESTLGLRNDKQESVNGASKSSASLPSLSLTISTHLENPDQLAEVRKDDLSSLQKLPKDLIGTNEQSGANSKSAKFGNTYMANEVDCMMRELYNGTLGNNTALDTDLSFDGDMDKNDYKLDLDVLTKTSAESVTSKVTEVKAKHASDFPPLSDALPSVSTEAENKKGGFFIYHDPTEVLPPKSGLIAAFPIFHDDQLVNNENMQSAAHDSLHENKDTPQDSETDENAIPKIHPVENVEDIPPYDANVDDENTENVPPAGYVQETEKRELAGILQPSKNIYYVPLEQQLRDDEMDEDINGGCMAGIRPLDDNLTMLTPEQFAAAACFASTPCVKSQITGIRESAKKADVNLQHDTINPPNNCENASLIQALNNAFSLANSPKVQDILKQVLLDVTKQEFSVSKESVHGVIEMLKLCHELTKNEKLKSVLQQCASLAETTILSNKDFNQTNALLHYRTLQLSTIMETSRESKSSSSSNSGITSVSKHKSVHSMQLSSVSKLTKTPIPEVIDNTELLEKDFGSPDKCQSELAAHSGRKNENGLLGGLDVDPFDPDITSRLLKALSVPISQREDFYDCKDTPIHIKSGSIVELGNNECMIENLYAEGAYAKVFSAVCLRSSYVDFDNTYLASPRLAIKVCKNANEWEFYICSELAERLHKRNLIPDITNSVLKVKSAVAFQNALIIVSDLFEQGTLLDVVNLYKSQKTRVPECLVIFFALEMLRIISGIHQCGIVHGDIKPDNFVLNNIPPVKELEAMVAQPRCLRLIDFGRAIDLTLYKPGVTFSVSVKTDAFQCTQMKEGRPWVYETDWYGVLGCIHILLFSDYMDVRKNGQGQWEPTQKFKRYFQNDVWQPMFHSLLNIPSPYEVPDLNPFIELLTQKLQKQMKDFKMQVLQMGMALSNRSRSTH